jgi:hypothetical protein
MNLRVACALSAKQCAGAYRSSDDVFGGTTQASRPAYQCAVQAVRPARRPPHRASGTVNQRAPTVKR